MKCFTASSVPLLSKYISRTPYAIMSGSRSVSYQCKKLSFNEFGDPLKVVYPDEEAVSEPSASEVLVKILVAPVNPADINIIQGTYPVKPSLPASPGFEGVGEVVAVGTGVTEFAVGDRVVPNCDTCGTWKSYTKFSSDGLLKVPNDMPILEAAGLTSNPCTAYRMLSDFTELKPGDAVIQNGANSACGQNVIQLCKAWGITSVNIVRDRPNLNELKEHLSSLGADHILIESELRSTQLFKSKEVPFPKLALNCVGGNNATEVMRHLAPKGVMVTYGGMSRNPVTIPTSSFIFKDLAFRGFWMTRWHKENRNSPARQKMIADLVELMKSKKIRAPAHKVVPLENYTEALMNTMSVQGFAGHKYFIDFRSLHS